MSIWFTKEINISQLNEIGKNNMAHHIGIEFLEAGEDYLIGRMPVDARTIQPYGLLHGGASVVLAETLGSIASHCAVNGELFQAVGIEVNANHIRSARSGYVTGKCTPLHLGGGTHVWEIKITDEGGKLVCVSRLTVAILKKPVS